MGIFPDTQGQPTPQNEVGSGQKFKRIQDFMVVNNTCKNEEDPNKNDGGRVATTLISVSDAKGQLTP